MAAAVCSRGFRAAAENTTAQGAQRPGRSNEFARYQFTASETSWLASRFWSEGKFGSSAAKKRFSEAA